MKIRYAIATLAACTMLSGTALADGPKDKKHKKNSQQTSSTSVSGGAATANRHGAAAGGVGAAQATTRQEQMGQRRDRDGRIIVPNTATTSTSGAVFTNRRSGSAAINTNGAASGSGSVRSSSEGEVFSSTNKQGSEADAYGNSQAEADEPNRN